MKKEDVTKKILSAISNFFVFFLLAAFVTTCCIMLFISALQGTIGRAFTEEEISVAAKITMLNVILLSIGMVIIDYVRRRIMVDSPVKMITDAAERIMSGDFSARVKDMHGAGMEGFNMVGKAINAMAEELSSVETLRTDFIANVSHEMKTPLAVMQNYGRLLEAPGLAEEKRLEYARAITDSSRRLADMMTNILKLNRLENQQIYPSPTTLILESSYASACFSTRACGRKKT